VVHQTALATQKLDHAGRVAPHQESDQDQRHPIGRTRQSSEICSARLGTRMKRVELPTCAAPGTAPRLRRARRQPPVSRASTPNVSASWTELLMPIDHATTALSRIGTQTHGNVPHTENYGRHLGRPAAPPDGGRSRPERKLTWPPTARGFCALRGEHHATAAAITFLPSTRNTAPPVSMVSF
jgi:hypothetical protein